jgi:hypothetical protein
VSNTTPLYIYGSTGAILAQLRQQDVEEFYIGYQYWNLQHQIEAMQIRLDDVRKQIKENNERMQEVQPTAIELATLARLQANGVSDVDLLDRMLERGEAWLDRTMQRLDYLEQLEDFISDDYTQWCQHALDGAYDWIDTALDGNATSQPSTATTSATTGDVKEDQGLVEATEELFLQKISTDEDEEFMRAITTKRPAIKTVDLGEADLLSEDSPIAEEIVSTLEHAKRAAVETNPLETNEDTKTSLIEEATHIEKTASEAHVSVENNAVSTDEQPALQEAVDISTGAQTPSSPQTEATPTRVSPRRPGLLHRFLGKIWGG